MGLTAIVLLACVAASSSKPKRNIFGNFDDIFGDLEIVDTQALLEQLIHERGYPLASVEIQSDEMKQVDTVLEARFTFFALSTKTGKTLECAAQISALVFGNEAQIQPKSSLSCDPDGAGQSPAPVGKATARNARRNLKKWSSKN